MISKIIRVAICIMILIGVKAYAESDESNLFCKSPYEAICGSNGEGAKARQSQVEDMLLPVREKALLDAVGDTNYDTIFDGKVISVRTLKQQIKMAKERKSNAEKQRLRKDKDRLLHDYHENLAQGIDNLFIKLLNSHHMNPNQLMEKFQFGRAKRYLRSAIETSKLDPAAIAFMKSRLAIIQLISVETLLRKEWLRTDRPMIGQYIDGCGYDGLTDNDFALSYFRGSDYLKTGEHLSVMIPCLKAVMGALNPILNLGKEQDTVMAEQIWTLGHEISHHFDGTDNEPDFKGETVYSKMYQCLEENKLNNKDILPNPSYANNQNFLKKSKKEQDQLVIADHIGEISADHWGNEVMAALLMEIPDLEIRYNIVKENLMGLCTDTDDISGGEDGIHPSAKFRIEMTRINSAVANALSCKTNSPPQLSCQPTGTFSN